MATIITVHGTGAAGSLEGTRWWQKGSCFEAHLGDLVVGENAPVTIEPFCWNGANQESSRRSAARALVTRMRQLEIEDQPYAIIGHSHGGSIIHSALIEAAATPEAFRNLVRCITVGTPFISFHPTGSTFSRLGEGSKALYLSVLFFCLLTSTFVFVGLWWSMKWSFLAAPFTVMTVAIAMFLPYLAMLLAFRAYLSSKLPHYGRRRRETTWRAFGERFQPLFHPHDEAMHALAMLRESRIEFFPRCFAVAPLVAVAQFALPIAVLVLSASATATREAIAALARVFPSIDATVTFGDGTNYLQNMLVWLAAVAASVTVPVNAFLETIGLHATPAEEGLSASAIVYLVCGIALSCGLIFLISYVFIQAIKLVARPLSTALSHLLNRVTWSQVRRSCFGNDMPGEGAVTAASHPVWSSNVFAPLPPELAGEITSASNAALSNAVDKFRGALALRSSEGVTAVTRSFYAEVLTWDELIHTAYFNVPRFRKLVACCLIDGKRVKASETFKRDTEFERIAGWAAEIRDAMALEATPSLAAR